MFLSNFNHSQNNSDKLQFLCEIVLYRKSPISAFQQIFTSTDKIIISGGELSFDGAFEEEILMLIL